jgi:hypothetical protein
MVAIAIHIPRFELVAAVVPAQGENPGLPYDAPFSALLTPGHGSLGGARVDNYNAGERTMSLIV